MSSAQSHGGGGGGGAILICIHLHICNTVVYGERRGGGGVEKEREGRE